LPGDGWTAAEPYGGGIARAFLGFFGWAALARPLVLGVTLWDRPRRAAAAPMGLPDVTAATDPVVRRETFEIFVTAPLKALRYAPVLADRPGQ
jgi:hypothetical protein